VRCATKEVLEILIFSSQPGVVGAVIDGLALPFAVAVGGVNAVPGLPTAGLFKAILTGFEVDQTSGLGVNHTLRDRIYVYAFGERAVPVNISGIAFGGVCGSAVGPIPGINYTGFDAVQAYYERVRISTQGLPVRLVFGPLTTLYGFMTGLHTRLEDPSNGIGSFAFKFIAMPRNAGRYGYLPPLPWSQNPADRIPYAQ
jgi:hypothetical protein